MSILDRFGQVVKRATGASDGCLRSAGDTVAINIAAKLRTARRVGPQANLLPTAPNTTGALTALTQQFSPNGRKPC